MKYLIRVALNTVPPEEVWLSEAGCPVEFNTLQEARDQLQLIREDPIRNSFDLFEPWAPSKPDSITVVGLEIWAAHKVE